MRKLIILLAAVALTGAAGMAALAGNSVSGSAAAVACAFGSCFVPSYSALSDVAAYKGPAAGRVEFSECCLAGDTYKVFLKGSRAKSTTRFTSAGTLNADCTTGPYLDDSAVELTAGATNARMTPVSVPGGFPASAYIRMSAGGWVQTVGVDSCGF